MPDEPAWREVLSTVRSAASIDLNGPGYWAAPGVDITAALQKAINAIAASGQSGEIYFSQPGTYNLNGPSQTGNAQGYNYAGQVLFPAVAQGPSAITIRIKGMVRPVTGNMNEQQGVILVSNATSGYVFDAIPALLVNGNPFTDVMPIFEDVIIRCVTNPQCGGINAGACLRFGARGLLVGTTLENSGIWPLTGALEALVLPATANSADVWVENSQIRGFPIGIRLSEHNVLEHVVVTYCQRAFGCGQGGHSCHFAYVDVENCPTVFYAASGVGQGLSVTGHLDWECTQATPGLFIDDVASLINGDLIVNMGAPGTGSGTSGGRFLNLRALRNVTIGQSHLGWMDSLPQDTFARALTPLTTGAPGLAWPSLHPWRVTTGSCQVVAGKLSSTNGTGQTEVHVPVRAVSRTVYMTVTLGASMHCRLAVGYVFGGTANAIYCEILSSGAFTLYVNGVSRASVAGVFTSGQTYTLYCQVLNNAQGNPQQLKVYAGTTLLTTYTLTAAESAALAPGTSGTTGLEDGVQFFDNTSTVSAFGALPAITGPASLASGTATLVAGTVTIANTNITANSIIRLNRQAAGGTLGELSVALTAGTSFTINSNNAADTSTIYYEIVSY